MKIFDEIISELETILEKENLERNELGSPPVQKSVITVLGQMSLMLDKTAAISLALIATADIDAIIQGDSVLRNYFLKIIKQKGLKLDDLSSEIWIPEEATLLKYYQSPLLTIQYLDPVSALTSKAIKAKEKNRYLIKQALEHYGEELKSKILLYGGDIDYFLNDEKLKL